MKGLKLISSTIGEGIEKANLNLLEVSQKEIMSNNKLGTPSSREGITHLSKADKIFDSIMGLQGVEEFKAMVQRQCKFKENKEKHFAVDIKLPNLFLVGKRGIGITQIVHIYAEYLDAYNLFEFTGNAKYFEYRLGYVAPNAIPSTFISELTKLNNTMTEVAGYNRFYRGLVCINIDEWARYTHDKYFQNFLEYLASKKNKILTILYIHSDNWSEVASIESSLSSHLCCETIWLRFPNADELVGGILTKYLKQRGYRLTEDAILLLIDSIEKITNGKHFNGFKTIEQLGEKIVRSLLESDKSNFEEISADMLDSFNKDSAYVKCIIGTNKGMGFNKLKEEYSK